MVQVLGLQLWGEIRIPQVLVSNTKTSILSYLARSAHRPPLTPLKYAQSKFKYTEASPRCTCLPPRQHCAEVVQVGEVHLRYCAIYIKVCWLWVAEETFVDCAE